jgi:hypothetical protein
LKHAKRSSFCALQSRPNRNLDIVAEARQHPQELVERTGRESTLEQRSQLGRGHLQERGYFVARQPSMLRKPLNSNRQICLRKLELRFWNP